MATQADVRRIALSLPDVTEEPNEFRFSAGGRMFVWLWPERVDPKKARVPNPEVVVVRTANDIDKQVLLALDREVFFTEKHYDGYNAVLVRLPKIKVGMLRDILTQGAAAAGTARSRSRTDRRSTPAVRPVRGSRRSGSARRRP